MDTLSRTGIVVPSADLHDSVHPVAHLRSIAYAVENKAVLYLTPGTLASRPAAGVLGRVFRPTDVGEAGNVYFDDGSVWVRLSAGIAPTTDDVAGVGSLRTLGSGAQQAAAGNHGHAVAAISGAAPLASPTFTGTPAAPTATAGTNTTQVATTAFVQAAVAAGGVVTTAVKTADEYVTSSTTMQDDDHLFVTLGVGKWRIEAVMYTYMAGSTTNGGFKAGWSFSGTSNSTAVGPRWVYSRNGTTATNERYGEIALYTWAWEPNLDPEPATSPAFGSVWWDGFLTVTASGTLRFRWAQSTSSSSSSGILTHSILTATKVA